MKLKILLSIHLTWLIVSAFSQNTIELNFTAAYNDQYVPLDSIFIENLTQGGDTTLYAPDTVLVLDLVTGTGGDLANGRKSFSLSQNYPNPFKGKTTISLNLPEPDHVSIILRDIVGRELLQYEQNLTRGRHSFTIVAGSEHYYLLTVSGKSGSKTIKMVSLPDARLSGGNCKIEYGGNTGFKGDFKSMDAITDFGFAIGDTLRYTGFAKTLYEVSGSNEIGDAPQGNENYSFNIKEGRACPGIPTITYEGQNYSTVQIGSQCWFRENLNVGIFVQSINTGTTHSDVSDNGIIEKYCMDNNEENCAIYGGLYDWDEMMGYTTTTGVQGICPEGWHIHRDMEFCILTTYLDSTVVCQLGWSGTTIAGKMKEPGTVHWTSTSPDVTNESGYTALGGGIRTKIGAFNALTQKSHFWSSTQYDSNTNWRHTLWSANPGITRGKSESKSGISVRCLKDEISVPVMETGSVSNLTNISADITGEIMDSGGSDIVQHGHCWSTETDPTVDDAKTELGATGVAPFTSNLTELEPGTLYYARAYAINSTGTGYGSEIMFTTDSLPGGCPAYFTDIEGNIYGAVQIGEQCWMKENLKTTTYSNGTSIPNVTDNSAWGSLTTGAYRWYDDDESWKDLYGGMYNFYSGVDINGLCPQGWHVPTYDEWVELIGFIGGASPPHGRELRSCRYVNSPLGGDCNTTEHPRWDESSAFYGTDDYGFAALPGGIVDPDGFFGALGGYGSWWSSSFGSSNYKGWVISMYNNTGNISAADNYFTQDGISVRCLKN